MGIDPRSPILGLDIGGANLKAYHSSGLAKSVEFPLWLKSDELHLALHKLVAHFPASSSWAITMTGEMADCFANRREGVQVIIKQCLIAAEQLGVPESQFYSSKRGLVSGSVASQTPETVASANWHATARWISSWIDRPMLVVDMGSTTTDLIPISPHRVDTPSISDFDRLSRGELVYMGIHRTSVAALVREVPWKNLNVPVMREYFASTDDIALILDWVAGDATDHSTCDGKPRTKDCARARLARVIGLDASDTTWDDIDRVAQSVERQMRDLILEAIQRQSNHGAQVKTFPWFIVGHANPFLRQIAPQGSMYLNDKYGDDVARVAPAAAVCELRKRMPVSGPSFLSMHK